MAAASIIRLRGALGDHPAAYSRFEQHSSAIAFDSLLLSLTHSLSLSFTNTHTHTQLQIVLALLLQIVL